MKHSIKILLFTILMAGCAKLNQTPVSSITLQNSFKTAQDANAGIISCYDALQALTKYILYWGEARTDVFANTIYTTTGQNQVITGNIDETNTTGFGSWNTAYTVINRANAVIKFVPGITDPAITSSRQRILGEAYYLRALTYFYLRRIFVNIPLITDPNYDAQQDFYVGQANPDDVTALIESDLKLAEAALPDSPYGTLIENKGRATRGAALSLETEFYLWKKDYTNSIIKATAVETSSQAYTLVPGANYGTIFTAGNTSESIFEVQFNAQDANNLLFQDFLPQSGTSPVYPGGGWAYQPSQKMKDSIATTDLRKSAIYQIVLPGVLNTPPFRNDLNKPYINKHQGNVVGTTRQGSANFIISRLADVILFRAEALNESGNTPAAITQVNRILSRAGLTTLAATASQGTVRTQIAKQRFVELSYEGKRYFDLVRTGKYAQQTGNTDPRFLYWPIELAERIVNNKLIQNQGY